MDIMEKIEEIVEKITENKDLLEQFGRNPAAVVEKFIGIDLPDEQMNQIIKGIQAKINVDKVSDLLGGLFKK